ncbi:hypothetical protein NHX12_018320 [Muraenolepis orangiensis]|uniref:Uncharacterized protein n=1 Tax=Muraenolepis orangiensis TaxID=630683 RepID=A0A9Q0EZ23_9TELE|nr:hypothetical protein NHX12_018320 [Muraenolepis orangiensis]
MLLPPQGCRVIQCITSTMKAGATRKASTTKHSQGLGRHASASSSSYVFIGLLTIVPLDQSPVWFWFFYLDAQTSETTGPKKTTAPKKTTTPRRPPPQEDNHPKKTTALKKPISNPP